MQKNPKKGDYDQQNYAVVWNAVRLAGAECAKKRRHVAGRRALRVSKAEALQQDHGRKRRQKWRHTALRNKKAVDKADADARACHGGDDRGNVGI